MKKILQFLLIVATLASYSQQKQFTIKWEGTKVLSTASFSIEVPYFNQGNFEYNLDSGLQFISQWVSTRYVNEKSVTVTNINYSDVSISELKDTDLKTIPSNLKYSLKNSTARGKN